jgi:hypothetical protein
MQADRLIAIAAFRYALGRMTYMPEHVGNWLIKNRDALPEHDRKLIIREIDEAERLHGLGMECDVATWKRVRKAFAAAPTEGEDRER